MMRKTKHAVWKGLAALGFALLGVLAAPVATAQTVGTCTETITNATLNIMPDPISVTIPSTLTAGTVIYSGTRLPVSGGTIRITCSGLGAPGFQATDTAILYWVGGTPNSHFPSVYDTNIPGIGVTALSSLGGTAIPGVAGLNFDVTFNANLLNNYSFNLVVTDPALVQSGSYNLAASGLPVYTVNWMGATFGGSGPAWTFNGYVTMGGTLNIVAATCTTPGDLTVPLGSHALTEFTGVGSVTSWVPFNIALTNCPAFPGFISYNNMGGVTTPIQTTTPNTIGVILTPTGSSPTIGAATNGTIAVDSTLSGAASGIAIQIANVSTGTPQTVDGTTSNPSGLVLSTTSPGNYNIPLEARYLQTDATLVPGTANGSVLYTITYQ